LLVLRDMPDQTPPFRRDRPGDLRPADAEEPRLVSFAMGSDADEYEDDEYEDDAEVVDPAVSRWLTSVLNRHA
jgi:hypothetical protein